MHLYHNPLSGSSRRAWLTAVHLDIDLELRIVDLSSGEQQSAEFLALNPNGVVPVLVDGEFVLTESHAIMQYLADKAPAQSLYPTSLQARADVNRWLFWCAQHFSPAISIFNWEHFIKPMIGAGSADPVELIRGEALIAQYASVLDRHLRNRQWVVGSEITLADFALGASLMHAESAKVPLARYPALQDWLTRVRSLPAWLHTEPKRTR